VVDESVTENIENYTKMTMMIKEINKKERRRS
jgi:hypothetical protein